MTDSQTPAAPSGAPASSYDGDVAPGGPAQVRELPGLTIRKLAVSEMSNNVYLLTDTATGEQLLVDAADDAEAILALVAEAGGRLVKVVTTHQHWDHHRALAAVLDATGARSAAGEDDADALPVAPDRRLAHGDTVTFGDVTLDVVHLRGHTPGSVALAYEDADGRTHLFTGDSLFPGGVGNTKNEGQSFEDLIADVTERVFDVYDDDTWVYPGHGGDTTLGAERPHLPEWRERGW
ncbi:MBL fold metallo-hydrolase [Lapillicoccus jejuensis]|uniref:Glyoxylase-like metal-dependent hydrolase (Beta-lactamase superfamily II) n=1 Tax=Lapillicoccus jejuensis TaxID=402171 RepID=A0A542E455_9MICO|nr:MBL fold metallo-hydrolase [Lapillicoccus jejuensis]TQJ10097.1 glyoxylase-like metal-dependent hydrolase (beta-lactamase superfamily II) [Lapillicoccus jejuensis]